MTELAEIARAARAALIAGDHRRLARTADESFDVRRRLLALDPRHVELVERARALGAGANYTGSGGAVVAVCRDQAHAARVARALSELGCGTLAP
jgi:glucuronokinase